jgi:hypothetical protein
MLTCRTDRIQWDESKEQENNDNDSEEQFEQDDEDEKFRIADSYRAFISTTVPSRIGR